MFSGEITGTGRVFRNERKNASGEVFHTYSIGFGSKKKDGTYDNASMDVRFMKDDVPTTWISTQTATYAEIEITHGFLTFRQYDTNDGRKMTRWLVQVIEWANK